MDGTEKNNQYINYANGDLMIYEKFIELLPTLEEVTCFLLRTAYVFRIVSNCFELERTILKN